MCKKSIKTALVALGLCVCAFSNAEGVDDASGPQDAAIAGHVADVVTTGAALAVGAAEANPLGLLTLGAKMFVAKRIEAQPIENQPRLWEAWGAFGWGASANNLCVIVSIATGGVSGLLCPLIGITTGVVLWPSAK